MTFNLTFLKNCTEHLLRLYSTELSDVQESVTFISLICCIINKRFAFMVVLFFGHGVGV